MADQATQLRLTIDAGPDADERELEALTLQLKDELIDLDVESVDLARAGEIPERAKVGDPVTWGDLILQLVAAGGVLTTLIGALQAWLTRHERRSVTVEIDGDKLELTGASAEQQQRLIDAWISRHSKTEVKDD